VPATWRFLYHHLPLPAGSATCSCLLHLPASAISHLYLGCHTACLLGSPFLPASNTATLWEGPLWDLLDFPHIFTAYTVHSHYIFTGRAHWEDSPAAIRDYSGGLFHTTTACHITAPPLPTFSHWDTVVQGHIPSCLPLLLCYTALFSTCLQGWTCPATSGLGTCTCLPALCMEGWDATAALLPGWEILVIGLGFCGAPLHCLHSPSYFHCLCHTLSHCLTFSCFLHIYRFCHCLPTCYLYWRDTFLCLPRTGTQATLLPPSWGLPPAHCLLFLLHLGHRTAWDRGVHYHLLLHLLPRLPPLRLLCLPPHCHYPQMGGYHYRILLHASPLTCRLGGFYLTLPALHLPPACTAILFSWDYTPHHTDSGFTRLPGTA